MVFFVLCFGSSSNSIIENIGFVIVVLICVCSVVVLEGMMMMLFLLVIWVFWELGFVFVFL